MYKPQKIYIVGEGEPADEGKPDDTPSEKTAGDASSNMLDIMQEAYTKWANKIPLKSWFTDGAFHEAEVKNNSDFILDNITNSADLLGKDGMPKNTSNAVREKAFTGKYGDLKFHAEAYTTAVESVGKVEEGKQSVLQKMLANTTGGEEKNVVDQIQTAYETALTDICPTKCHAIEAGPISDEKPGNAGPDRGLSQRMDDWVKNSSGDISDGMKERLGKLGDLKDVIKRYKQTRTGTQSLIDHITGVETAIKDLMASDGPIPDGLRKINDEQKSKDSSNEGGKDGLSWKVWLFLFILLGGLTAGLLASIITSLKFTGCYQHNLIEGKKSTKIKICSNILLQNYYQTDITGGDLGACMCTDSTRGIRLSPTNNSASTQEKQCKKEGSPAVTMSTLIEPGCVNVFTPSTGGIQGCIKDHEDPGVIRWEDGSLKACNIDPGIGSPITGVRYEPQWLPVAQVIADGFNDALKCVKDPLNCLGIKPPGIPSWLIWTLIIIGALIVLFIIYKVWVNIRKNFPPASGPPNAGQDDIEMVPMRRVKKGT